MNERMGFGGFFFDNIRNWIIKECLESGDPLNFFLTMQDVMDELDEDQSWLSEKEGNE